MTLDEITVAGIDPALALLPKNMDSPMARVMLLAIGLQESRFEHRYQVTNEPGVKGPARGFWQFEKGGVRGVWRHHASAEPLRLLCRERECPLDPTAIWQQIETDDVLAAGVARLLLWTDPFPLPTPDQSDKAWTYYERNWRPGKPHPEFWANNFAAATAVVFPPPEAAHITGDDL
jgi:hypothetical protein